MSIALFKAAPPFAAALLLVALAACGGSIQSSPRADAFNAALDRCQAIDNQSRRNACARNVLTRYSRATAED